MKQNADKMQSGGTRYGGKDADTARDHRYLQWSLYPSGGPGCLRSHRNIMRAGIRLAINAAAKIMDVSLSLCAVFAYSFQYTSGSGFVTERLGGAKKGPRSEPFAKDALKVQQQEANRKTVRPFYQEV